MSEVEDAVVERRANGSAALAEQGRNAPMVAPAAGVHALAMMGEQEFEQRLTQMEKGRDRVRVIIKRFMTEGVHYYALEGRKEQKDSTGKPIPGSQYSLSKAGAELLCQLYGYVAEPLLDAVEYGDVNNVDDPAIRVRFRCHIHLGTLDGPVVGVGFGAANTWETKYRWRKTQRKCPKCGEATIYQSKYPAKGGPFKGQKGTWFCWRDKGGCGAEFDPNEPAVILQPVGQATNEEAMDLENTLLKMAEKRAKVDGTIAASGTSDVFTQDAEDLSENKKAATGTPAPAGNQGKPRSAPAVTTDTGHANRDRFMAVAKAVGATKVKDLLVLVKLGTGQEYANFKALDAVSEAVWESMVQRARDIAGMSEDEALAFNAANAKAPPIGQAPLAERAEAQVADAQAREPGEEGDDPWAPDPASSDADRLDEQAGSEGVGA